MSAHSPACVPSSSGAPPLPSSSPPLRFRLCIGKSKGRFMSDCGDIVPEAFAEIQKTHSHKVSVANHNDAFVQQTFCRKQNKYNRTNVVKF